MSHIITPQNYMQKRMESPFKSYEINCSWFSLPQDNSRILRNREVKHYTPYLNFDDKALPCDWTAKIIVYNDHSFIGRCFSENPNSLHSLDYVWGSFIPNLGIAINKWFPGFSNEDIEIPGLEMSGLRINCYQRENSDMGQYYGSVKVDSHLGTIHRFGPAHIEAREIELEKNEIDYINQIYYNKMINDVSFNPQYATVPIYTKYGLYPAAKFAMNLDPSIISKKDHEERLKYGYNTINQPLNQARQLIEETHEETSPLTSINSSFADHIQALNNIEKYFPNQKMESDSSEGSVQFNK